jgi:polyhydroxyalkanoate synthesis repressor PhaR
MPLIKRYPNRKLYDTEAKQYITLEGIAVLIRQGQEIQVIDNATGEDLTALTLTQIILDFGKKQGGFLPRNILAGIIQASGDRLSSLQKSLASSVGFVQQLDDEIRRRVHLLVSQGEMTEAEGKSLLGKLLNPGIRFSLDKNGSVNQKDIERMLAERQVPTREEIQTLSDQLDELSTRLDSIDQEE